MNLHTDYFTIAIAIVISTAALFSTTDSFGQNRYTCRMANGSYVVSDQACATNAGITYYPPLNQTVTRTAIPKAGDAPDYLQYLSPRCSSMNDAIRTSSARGLSYKDTSELQRNYQRECADNESEARNLLSQERGESRKAMHEAKQSAVQAQQQANMAQQQCDESKRIIANKKRRADLNDGERAELLRFEDNIRARCR